MMKPPLFILFACLTLSACQDRAGQEAAEETTNPHEEPMQTLIQCPDNRPEACTQIYQPVCGLVDTGIRCITTPCPSAEFKTFGNACTACSDNNVTGYNEGECPASETEAATPTE